MYSAGHHATGMAAGVFASGLLWHLDPHIDPAVLPIIALCGWWGGVAPDRLEWVPFIHVRWTPHRTLTHWGIVWIALLVYAIIGVHDKVIQAALGGFALGGLAHLLGDWPNPTGVPWLWPRDRSRHSLRWWVSGHYDTAISLFAWLIALIPWAFLVPVVRHSWALFSQHPGVIIASWAAGLMTIIRSAALSCGVPSPP